VRRKRRTETDMAIGFSPNAKQKLGALLDRDADEIITELEQVVAACPTQKDFTERIIPQWREHLRQLETLHSALLTAQSELGSGDPPSGISWLDDLDHLAQHVDERIDFIERWFDYSGSGKRGRPRNEPRWWLANVAGYVLQWHGIALTKTHTVGGRFHKVLLQVIEAAEGTPPEEDNVADLTDATVDLLRPLTAEQFEAIDFGIIGFMRLSRPWRSTPTRNTKPSH